jgi:Aerotolerance regulator N-terminal
MSFLQPVLLFGLPLALLPILIHLINQHRHRTVHWAAMMFLLDAKKLTKGLARLRQILILAMRVLAILLLLFAASRPLAGGWAGRAGGRADTVLILLDRSASMEEQNLSTGESKRSTAITKLVDLLEKTSRGSEIVLIDSVTLSPTIITDLKSLGDLPVTAGTVTASDIPTLLQTGLDYLHTTDAGRTDLWLASDSRMADWSPDSGSWATLRADLIARDAVRVFLLNFPEISPNNLAVSVENVTKQSGLEGPELLLDLTIRRPVLPNGNSPPNQRIPLELTVSGTRTIQDFELVGEETVVLGHRIPLGQGEARGWGRIDLPADDNPADNSAFFVYDDPTPRLSVVVSNDDAVAGAVRAVVSSPVESDTKYEVVVVRPNALVTVPWERVALLCWHAALPEADSNAATLLTQHLASGRSVVFFPPAGEGGPTFLGASWGDWQEDSAMPLSVTWWRTETGLLSNTRNGAPLPVGDWKIARHRPFIGDSQSLLRIEPDINLIARIIHDGAGSAYFLGTLPRPDHANLVSEGIAFFALLHRVLDEGSDAVSRARSLTVSGTVLNALPRSEVLAEASPHESLAAPGLHPAALQIGQGDDRYLLALQRSPAEDDHATLSPESEAALLEGVEYRRITDTVGSGSALASEIWRIFLFLMAVALVAEAVLCLPPNIAHNKRSVV